jgi:FkbM family methyltransferase
MLVHRALDFAQRTIARSRPLVRLAILLRNQARCVIKYHLAESPDVAFTGEVWLREAVAAKVDFAVDVGANVGDWLEGIRAFKGAAPFQALAFEPSSTAASRLRERFANDVRVTILEAAVGDVPGSLAFLEEPDAGKGSSLVPDFHRGEGTTRMVSVATLDAEIARAGWDRVDFLKIDAEGYDLRVLRGAADLLRAQRIGVAQFEYNRAWQLAGDTLRAAYTLLEACGYAVYLLKRDGLYTLNYQLYEEYFEYSNFVAISPPWLPLLRDRIRGTI